MSNKIVLLLVVLMVVSIALIGCSTNEMTDEALIANSTEKNEQKVENKEPVNDEISNESSALKDRAKQEGVSVSEMEKMVEELTKMTAERYGDTAENYKASLKAEGKTPFDEFSVAADYMGITIKEYYQYEKNKPALSAEDKETVDGMQNAIEGIDLSSIENQLKGLEENAQAMENAGDNETSGDALQIANFEVSEVKYEEYDSQQKIYVIEYTSRKGMPDIVEHFKSYLESTANYFIMDGSPETAMINGTVNGNKFDVQMQRDIDNEVTLVLVTYYGEVEKEIDSTTNEETSQESKEIEHNDNIADNWYEYKLIEVLDDNEDNSKREYVYSTSASVDEFKEYFESILKDEDEYIFSDDDFGSMHYCWKEDYYYKITLLDGEEYNMMLEFAGYSPREVDDDIIMVEIIYSPQEEVVETLSLERVKEWAIYELDGTLGEEEFSNGTFRLDYQSKADYEEVYNYFVEKTLIFDNIEKSEYDNSYEISAEKDGYEIYIICYESSMIVIGTNKIW